MSIEGDVIEDVAAETPTLDTILNIPVSVQVVLGGTTMPVSALMKLGRGAIVTLDQRVGQPVDVVVNGHVVARGEMVVIEGDASRLGVSLTDIVGTTKASLRG
ncbi:MAG TPA: flagellar motor switch protein FliN [Lichenihabitans sp.]|jgi:flagellar motor switch protein FliN/FliY|nr:flagellar motor switch protein FliN [Lichenihabitans sp.]